MDVFQLLFATLIFPGLVFLTALSFLTQYLVRKLSARMQRRMGPKYVGPVGILQPVYDFLKLLRAKELLKTRYSMIRAAEISLLLGLSSLVASMLLLPLNVYSVGSPYDFLIFFYMASIWPIIMIIIASLSMPGPYTSVGVSRLLSILTVSEPAFFTGLLVPVALASFDTNAPLMISATAVRVVNLWMNPLTLPIMILVTISLIVAVQSKLMLPPFNIPEAEQEIIAGYETEFSGPLLALAILLHDMDTVVSALAIVYLVLGGPAPFSHASIEGVLLVILKYFLVITVATYVKNVFGRYRIDQALVLLLKYGLMPAVIAGVLGSIYLYL
ncbi:NADH-quinone oxidoreductase subunit H [Thermosphaera chiliense]|uniref:NADH-quinone oxidoreductase subunit H n=2 Tax=Thermosphaera chiliense TaxID=3402707 RepID=A0A7M1USF0_9CREN|nr:NADH-quinone oxidoreductase subunit H [Thermosphaera aggregans]